MPDLGKYAFEVGLAYGLSISMLVGLIGYMLWRSNRMQKTLKRIEERREGASRNG